MAMEREGHVKIAPICVIDFWRHRLIDGAMAGDEQRKAVKVIVPSDETEEQKKARIAKEEVPLSRRPDNAGKPEKDDPYADMVGRLLGAILLQPKWLLGGRTRKIDC